MDKAKATQCFVVRAVGRIILGRSVSKIIIIALNLGFGTSKNENNDIEVKKIVLMKVITSLCSVILRCQMH